MLETVLAAKKSSLLRYGNFLTPMGYYYKESLIYALEKECWLNELFLSSRRMAIETC